MDLCPLCGSCAYFCVHDVFFQDRSFTVDACCEGNLEGWLQTISELPRRQRARWMLEQTGIRVKDILVEDGLLSWTIDYGLHLAEISFGDAGAFVAEHHRHCGPPTG